MIDWFCMYKKSKETNDNFLIHCAFTRELRLLVFSLFRVQWKMPRGVVDLLAC